jgi:hypothetical protein
MEHTNDENSSGHGILVPVLFVVAAIFALLLLKLIL